MKRSQFTGALASLIMAAFFLASAILWTNDSAARSGQKHEITAEQVYNPENLKKLENLARSGNAEAAWTLSLYYAFFHKPHTSEDDVLNLKWLKLSALNGKPEAMVPLAVITQEKGGSKNCARAVILVRKALAVTHDPRTIKSANSALWTFKQSRDCAGLI